MRRFDAILHFALFTLCTLHTHDLPFAGPIPSVRPSVRDKSEHCKNGGYIGSLTEVITGLFMGPISKPLGPPLLLKLEAHNPLSNLESQLAAKQSQIQQWFVLTAHGNTPWE